MNTRAISRATVAVLLFGAFAATAAIDLVTLPTREGVQLTIYNSADLTLVRDLRQLTMKQGLNRLQFSWENTLIDPTSLEMEAKNHADAIDIFALIYPPRTKNLGRWRIDSRVSGKVPMEITYLTSGLSWRAFYMGTLTEDERFMRLKGYVRVANNSGEEYENAQVRLIVGKVNLIDQIAELARRQYAFGSPLEPVGQDRDDRLQLRRREVAKLKKDMDMADKNYGIRGKQIVKEGLSEYFLYTIEGEETIPNTWSKRLPSFEAGQVPVVNLYKYEEERWGGAPVRFLSFQNDQKHQLGETPIPGGMLKVYRQVDPQAHLAYEGQSSFKYIPVDEDVELNLGAVSDVIVEPVLMRTQSDKFMFDNDKRIIGWDDIGDWQVDVRNTRDLPVKVEITRNFRHGNWDIKNGGDYGDYTKIDMDTVRYTLELKPRSSVRFTYTVTLHEGRRAVR